MPPMETPVVGVRDAPDTLRLRVRSSLVSQRYNDSRLMERENPSTSTLFIHLPLPPNQIHFHRSLPDLAFQTDVFFLRGLFVPTSRFLEHAGQAVLGPIASTDSTGPDGAHNPLRSPARSLETGASSASHAP